MAERLRVYWTSGAGVGHEEWLTGDRFVSAVNGETAVVRIHGADGTLASVHTFTRVNRVDWYPSSEENK